MSIKNIVYIMALIAGSPIAAMNLGDYTEEDLVLTRIAWGHHEKRLKHFMFEARVVAPNHIAEYFCGVRHVATINANNKTVATHLSAQESIVLSYEDIRWLLSDERMLTLANERLARESQSND